MNWDAIGAIAEVVGVATILLSLIYVAVQIRQNNKIAQAEAERDLLHHWMLGLDSLVADKWTTEVFLRGLADFDSLTSVEKTRLSYKLIRSKFCGSQILWSLGIAKGDVRSGASDCPLLGLQVCYQLIKLRIAPPNSALIVGLCRG